MDEPFFFFDILFVKMWNGALKLATGATFLLLMLFVFLRNLSHGADFLVMLPASFDAVKILYLQGQLNIKARLNPFSDAA